MSLVVTSMVHFFPYAQKTNSPSAAMVLDVNENDVCRLLVWDRHGGSRVIPTCYHVSAECLRDHTGAPSQVAKNSGGWDYPEAPEKKKKEKKKDPSSAELTQKEKEEKIVSLSKGYVFEDVCKKVRHLGLSQSEVEEIYERKKLRNIFSATV